jgi:hypothetical protein
MTLVRVMFLAMLAAAAGACQRDVAVARCPCLEGWTCCPVSERCSPPGIPCPPVAGAATAADSAVSQEGGAGAGAATGGGQGGAGGGRGGSDGSGGNSTGGGGGMSGEADGATQGSDGSGMGATDGPDASAGGDRIPIVTAPAPGQVTCGGSTCNVRNGGHCCYNPETGESWCEVVGVICTERGGVITPNMTSMACDGTEDCAVGQICCHRSVYIDSITSCGVPGDCVDRAGRYTTIAHTVCRPGDGAGTGTGAGAGAGDGGTGCATGTCRPAMEASATLPPYLNLCI